MAEKKYTLSQLRSAWGAGRYSAENDEPKHPLVDKWFHQYIGEDLGWQGHVKLEISENKFLVQLFSYFDGAPTDQKIIYIDEMESWMFYDSFDDMDAAFARYAQLKGWFYNRM